MKRKINVTFSTTEIIECELYGVCLTNTFLSNFSTVFSSEELHYILSYYYSSRTRSFVFVFLYSIFFQNVVSLLYDSGPDIESVSSYYIMCVICNNIITCNILYFMTSVLVHSLISRTAITTALCFFFLPLSYNIMLCVYIFRIFEPIFFPNFRLSTKLSVRRRPW